jgi:putative ABC transport system permease protein
MNGPTWRTMAGVGLRMMFHDRFKFAGTLFGVVFSVVLSVQQIGVLLGLLAKNTMFVDNAGADVWVVPPGTELLQPGQPMSDAVLMQARATEGVARAEPLVFAAAGVLKPAGGTEGVTLVGAAPPYDLGGPWNIVAGTRETLHEPDTMLFEESQRETLGGLNLDGRREVNGHRVRVGGFTWGLLPFGPSYAFADIRLARDLVDLPSGDVHFVLVRVAPGHDPAAVARRLQARVPEVSVVTARALHDTIVATLLRRQLGVSFGTSTLFGLVVGFVIVSLTMFSSVLDNLREFGTLKALGCESRDLTHLVLVQSVAYAGIGTFVGLGVAALLADVMRSAELSVIIPAPLLLAAPVVTTVMCMLASGLAVLRIRRLEPGMVFR